MTRNIDKKLLLNEMKTRLDILQDRSDRDFGGNFDSKEIGAMRELKFWIGKVERNELDEKVWGD